MGYLKNAVPRIYILSIPSILVPKSIGDPDLLRKLAD
jgi:hypothetical protein